MLACLLHVSDCRSGNVSVGDSDVTPASIRPCQVGTKRGSGSALRRVGSCKPLRAKGLGRVGKIPHHPVGFLAWHDVCVIGPTAWHATCSLIRQSAVEPTAFFDSRAWHQSEGSLADLDTGRNRADLSGTHRADRTDTAETSLVGDLASHLRRLSGRWLGSR